MIESGIEQIGAADIVMAIVPPASGAVDLEAAIARVVEVPAPVRAVLLYPPFPGMAPAAGAQWQIVPYTQLAQNPSALAQSLGDSFRAVFEVTEKLGARACAIVASH